MILFVGFVGLIFFCGIKILLFGCWRVNIDIRVMVICFLIEFWFFWFLEILVIVCVKIEKVFIMKIEFLIFLKFVNGEVVCIVIENKFF